MIVECPQCGLEHEADVETGGVVEGECECGALFVMRLTQHWIFPDVIEDGRACEQVGGSADE
jgi:hypothetical protein